MSGLPDFEPRSFFNQITVEKLPSLATLRELFATPAPEQVRIGVALRGTAAIYLFQRLRNPGELDVQVLHRELLEGALGPRNGQYLRYVRGLDEAEGT